MTGELEHGNIWRQAGERMDGLIREAHRLAEDLEAVLGHVDNMTARCRTIRATRTEEAA